MWKTRRRKEEKKLGNWMEGGKEGRKGKKGEGEGWGVLFWNVAGLKNKDKDFWESLKEWEVIMLSETWMEGKEWERMKGRFPKGYKWGIQGAVREGKRGRAKGGIIMGVREELVEGKISFEEGAEGAMMSEISVGKERWRIVGVYVNEGIEKMRRKIERWTDKGVESRKLIIGGDFNARVGREGGGFEGEDGESRERKAKDETINAEGRRLLDWVEEEGWCIFNGRTKGDEEGEYTFTGGRGNTTIDYVIGEEETWERIERLKIGDRIDSDHHPVEVRIKGRGGKRVRERREKKVWRGIWDMEGRERFKQMMENIERMEGSSVEEQWREMSGRVKRTLKEIEEDREREAGRSRRKGWWDAECREEKRKVRRKLREWRRGVVEEEEYRKGKREYIRLCERKKREEGER